MDRMLYVAMTGARQTFQAQAVNNHNLANVSTTGFRQDVAAFRSMPVFGEGLPSRVYAMAERSSVNTEPGAYQTTDRELDVAVAGRGWIAVQAPDGQEAYTRAGNLHLSAGNVLTTAAGYPVMGDAGPIALPPAAKVDIGVDGTISIVATGDTAAGPVASERIKLVNPAEADLIKDEFGLMRTENGEPAPADAAVRLQPGALESSNVNAAEALVTMIGLARQYEMQIKMMTAAAENSDQANQLLRLA